MDDVWVCACSFLDVADLVRTTQATRDLRGAVLKFAYEACTELDDTMSSLLAKRKAARAAAREAVRVARAERAAAREAKREQRRLEAEAMGMAYDETAEEEEEVRLPPI